MGSGWEELMNRRVWTSHFLGLSHSRRLTSPRLRSPGCGNAGTQPVSKFSGCGAAWPAHTGSECPCALGKGSITVGGEEGGG